MINVLRRIWSKLGRLWFAAVHAPAFRLCGRGVHLYSPFRIDGVERIELGSRTVFQRGSWLYCSGVGEKPAALVIGEGCIFGYNNHIAAVREVRIGRNVLTANNVYISDNLHSYEDTSTPIMHQAVRFKGAVIIGDGCWIGENACILGVRIGKNCVVGANAVVTRDLPDFSVAVGVPAMVIKQFNPQLRLWVSTERRS